MTDALLETARAALDDRHNAERHRAESQGRELLLAWWNAEACGGFDLTELWGVDAAIAADMVMVFAALSMCQHDPDTPGYGAQFEAIVRAWRPTSKEDDGQEETL